MSVLMFKVRALDFGWVVEDAETFGPFTSREKASDLAEGMAAALTASGERAAVVYEDELLARPARRSRS